MIESVNGFELHPWFFVWYKEKSVAGQASPIEGAPLWATVLGKDAEFFRSVALRPTRRMVRQHTLSGFAEQQWSGHAHEYHFLGQEQTELKLIQSCLFKTTRNGFFWCTTFRKLVEPFAEQRANMCIIAPGLCLMQEKRAKTVDIGTVEQKRMKINR